MGTLQFVLANDLLADAFDRIREEVHGVVAGLSPEELAFRPDPQANSIAWLVWHLTRIADDHVAALDLSGGTEQVWTARGWFDRFGLPLDKTETGWGHSPDDVAKVTATGDLLVGYFDDVHAATVAYVGGLSEDDYGRIVDRRWDPPVTLAVRLVSVIGDDLEHAGQAAYLRGIVERRR